MTTPSGCTTGQALRWQTTAGIPLAVKIQVHLLFFINKIVLYTFRHYTKSHWRVTGSSWRSSATDLVCILRRDIFSHSSFRLIEGSLSHAVPSSRPALYAQHLSPHRPQWTAAAGRFAW